MLPSCIAASLAAHLLAAVLELLVPVAAHLLSDRAGNGQLRSGEADLQRTAQMAMAALANSQPPGTPHLVVHHDHAAQHALRILLGRPHLMHLHACRVGQQRLRLDPSAVEQRVMPDGRTQHAAQRGRHLLGQCGEVVGSTFFERARVAHALLCGIMVAPAEGTSTNRLSQDAGMRPVRHLCYIMTLHLLRCTP